MNTAFLSDSTMAFSSAFVPAYVIAVIALIVFWWIGCVRKSPPFRKVPKNSSFREPWRVEMAAQNSMKPEWTPPWEDTTPTRKTDAELVATGRFYIGTDGCLKMKRSAGTTIATPGCARIQRTSWH